MALDAAVATVVARRSQEDAYVVEASAGYRKGIRAHGQLSNRLRARWEAAQVKGEKGNAKASSSAL